ncbi:hypothetical protein CXU21_00700 [Akkermansia muciniphila]|nr:hypothetical protein CXU21_00700 [Akkermansia muciniphila]
MEWESRPLSCWRFFDQQSRSIRAERPEWLSGCGGIICLFPFWRNSGRCFRTCSADSWFNSMKSGSSMA